MIARNPLPSKRTLEPRTRQRAHTQTYTEKPEPERPRALGMTVSEHECFLLLLPVLELGTRFHPHNTSAPR